MVSTPYGMCEFGSCIEKASKGSRYCGGFHGRPKCSVARCKKPRTPYRALCQKHLNQYEIWSQCKRPISRWLEARQIRIDKKQAENPDTKPLLLLKLAELYPKTILQNPGLHLLKVGDPALHSQIVCTANLEIARTHCDEAASPYSKEELLPWVCDCAKKLLAFYPSNLAEKALAVARTPEIASRSERKKLRQALKQKRQNTKDEDKKAFLEILLQLLSPDEWFSSPVGTCFELARILAWEREQKETHKSHEERLWPEVSWQIDRLYFHLRRLERGVA